MQLLQDLNIQEGTRVLLRCDLNLPQNDQGVFTDFFRLESSVPTISYLLDQGATVFIISHLGSPKGTQNSKLSLQPVAEVLASEIGGRVEFIADPFKENISDKKGVFLLENLRFWSGEEESSLDFAKEIVKETGAEIFIQDAFGVAHRDHASLTKFPELLPSAAGFLLQKEIQYLDLSDVTKLCLIVGGAKVESKLPVIKNFLNKAENILTGGVVANTFLKASDREVGVSIVSSDNLELAKQILEDAKQSSTKLILPRDYSAATSSEALLAHEFDGNNLGKEQMILDLGTQTTSDYKIELNKALNIVWAGTLGFAENPIFAEGSKQILKHILALKAEKPELKITIGGGDTVDFTRDNLSPEELGLIDHLSTGGGASLLMLSGEELPGITALNQRPEEVKEVDTSPISDLKAVEEQVTVSKEVPFPNKKPVLVANLKAHFNLDEARNWLQDILKSKNLTSAQLEFIVAAPDLALAEMSSAITKSEVVNKPKVYAEDISAFTQGAQTGEISATMLEGVATGTLLGHSERRNKLGESNEVISQKILQSIAANLNMILCVGGKSQNLNDQRREVYDQLKSALVNFSSDNEQLLTIAYEPVFAIGSGDVPTPEFLQAQLSSIREINSDAGLNPKVVYGGSVDGSNAKEVLDLGFDGLLVGSASLKSESLEQVGINMLS